MPAVPLLTQLPVNGLGKQCKMAQTSGGGAIHVGDPDEAVGFAWPNPDHCGLPGSKSAGGNTLLILIFK